MKNQSFMRWLESVRTLRAVVAGDAVLEHTVIGKMVGVTPEAPAPLVRIQNRYHGLGAGAFAAEIMAALGAQVEFVGVVGDDHDGELLLQQLLEKSVGTNWSVRQPGCTTRTLTRVAAVSEHNPRQEILRLEDEPAGPIPPQAVEQLLENLRRALQGANVLLLVEQGKGIAGTEFLTKAVELARQTGTPVVGDLQTTSLLARGFTALVVNDEEASSALGLPVTTDEEAVEAAQDIRRRTSTGCVLLTRGPRPAVLACDEGGFRTLPVQAVPVYDVTGAGETVSSVWSLGIAAGMSAPEAAELALQAASLCVTQPGRTVVTPQELARHIERQRAALQAEKIVSLARLREIVAEAKRRAQRVVWTNGCFDLLHVGHILYLEKAKQLGDLLIVGLNSDASVRATKGPSRPIVNEAQRARLLASLTCTDYVIIFDEPSPKKIIAELQPDVYVKGGDYTIDTINQEERRIVESYGGEIALLPGVEGMSTSELIRRILAAYGRSQTHHK